MLIARELRNDRLRHKAEVTQISAFGSKLVVVRESRLSESLTNDRL